MNRTRQRGITMIGWLFLLVPVALVVFSAIRVTPMYLNNFKVKKVLDQVAEEFKGTETVQLNLLRNSLNRRLDIEQIEYPTIKDMTIERQGKSFVISAKYEEVAPLFANVSLLISFDKSVSLE